MELKSIYICERPVIFEGSKNDGKISIDGYQHFKNLAYLLDYLKTTTPDNRVIFSSESGDNTWLLIKKNVVGLDHLNGSFKRIENIRENLSIKNFNKYIINDALKQKLIESISQNSPFNPLPDRMLIAFYLFGHLSFSTWQNFSIENYDRRAITHQFSLY